MVRTASAASEGLKQEHAWNVPGTARRPVTRSIIGTWLLYCEIGDSPEQKSDIIFIIFVKDHSSLQD